MNQAGQYRDRLERMQRTYTTNSGNGQREYAFSATGVYFWCRLEKTTGTKNTEYGAEQTGADVTIYVRNTPSITALDALSDGDNLYRIEHMYTSDDRTELIIDANYYDDLIIGEE